VVAPLRQLGTPLTDVLQRKPYVVHQKTFDATVPHFNRYYWKSHSLPPLSDGAIDTMIEYAWQAPSPLSYTIVFQLGGQVRRVGEMDTAYGNRDAALVININSNWTDREADAENIAWAREYFDAMTPYSTGGVYVNFLGNEGEERIKAAYGPKKYERLAALKRMYDPANVFRFNQNIAPSAG
jgi:FAD/FMN-containing dehydrogenase